MSKSPFVITFSGDPLAGKSSAIEALAKRYEEEGFFIGERDEGKCIIRLAAGKMFRDIAAHSGIMLQDLNAFAKRPGNTIAQLKELANDSTFFTTLTDEVLQKSVDSFVDEYMLNHIELLKAKYDGKDDVIIIVDSRIAGLLMKCKGRENMCIRLSTLPEIAAERLIKDESNRSGEISLGNIEENEAYNIALESVRERTSKERERFIITYSSNLYNQSENAKVDIQNLNNYDLVINTSGTTIEREVVVLHDCIEKARHGQQYDKFWGSTKYIYPGSTTEQDITDSKVPKILAVNVSGQYYAFHGQEYVGVANRKGYEVEKKLGDERDYPLVPIEIIAQDQQFVFERDENGEMRSYQADRYIKKNITKKVIEKFQNKYGFRYPAIGVKKLKDDEKKKRKFMPEFR